MKQKLCILLTLLSFLVPWHEAEAQTLAAGDIAFVGYHTDADDGFTFIALKDIPANEVIYFTDKGWNATGNTWYANAEDHIVWTSPGITMGTIVSIIETSGDFFTVTALVSGPGSTSGGTAVLSAGGSGFSLLGGDNIFAYQSSSGAEPANPTFIAGLYGDDNYVHTAGCDDAGGWLNCATCTHISGPCTTNSGDTSGMPSSLTNGVNAVALFPLPASEEDNAKYTGTLSGSVSVVRAAINTPANWTTSEDPIDITANQYSGVNITPDAPPCALTVYNVTGGGSFCQGGSGVFIGLSDSDVGVSYQLYLGSDPSGSPVNGTGNNISFGTRTAAGTYTIVASNGGSCQQTMNGSATITVNPLPTITLGTSPTVPQGATSANLPYTATTNSPVTYTITWSATALAAGFTNISTPQPLPASPIVITVPATAPNNTYVAAIRVQTATCNSTSTIFTVTVTNPNSAPTFTGGSPQALQACRNSGAVSINNLLQVNDTNNGQTLTWSVTSPASNGTVAASYTAATNGGQVTPTGLSYTPNANYTGSDSFTIQVSDGFATASTTINVTVSGVDASITSQTNIACNGGATGSVTVTATNGTGPYTYLWNDSSAQTTATATGLTAGPYQVTVTDVNGCTATANTTITQPASALTLTPASQTNIACNGGSTGAASVNVATGGAGGYTYNWTPGNPTGDGTTSVTGLTAGTWTCTVTDNNGCTASVNFTVTQPTALSLTPASQTNIACNGGATGAVSVNVATGGAGGYTYNWTPGNPTGDGTTSVTGLTAGTWTCTVTDNNGCTASVNFTVTQPTALSLTASSQTNVACNGGANGSATVSVSGGTVGYTYSWAPMGGTAATATGLSAGTYTVTVTDANGCEATQSFTITEPAASVSGSTVVTDLSCSGGNDGTINLTPTGGTGPYTYDWGGGITTEDRTGLAAGNYTVTITDFNGCTGTVNATVNGATGCATIATVTTDDITVYTVNSFSAGGNVTDDGDAAVTEKGIVYSTSANPTTADTKVQMGAGEGMFSETVSSLTPGETYYIRAYAVNSEGTAYGNEVVFTMPYGIINLVHNSTSTQYPTIQQAVNASVTGDMVTLGAGTYIEQVTVTTGITIQGVGTSQTIVRSPLAANLVVNGGWKTLKAQDVVAIIGVKTDDASQVTIKDLTVDGFDQGYLPDATFPNKDSYAFQGIGALNTNLLVENVNITGVRELATDFGATIPAGYLPADQPSGMNHNEAIFAESAAGAGNHTLEVRNSYIEKFQKTAILAWGPTLDVNIHDNTIQGYGQTLYSTGNGIQIASTDRTSLGGANGDRRGTTGIITNNQILGIGVVIPEPGEPGSYLNLGMYGPSAILTYEAGSGLVLSNNTITRTPYQSWYNDYISNDGGFSNAGIAVYNSSNASVTGNTISGFDVAIAEIGAVNGSLFNISGNTVSDNRNDYFTAQNNDNIVLSNSAETLTYYANSQGVDIIDNFGAGDRINVIGLEPGSINGELSGSLIVDFTTGTVTEGDGTAVAANSVQIQQNTDSTTLFIDTDGVAGQAELELELTGIYQAGNFTLNGGFIAFTVAPPVASAQQFCEAATVADLEATGDNLQWYDVATGGSPLTGDTNLATGTYYVSQTQLGVESDRTSVAVTINTPPVASAVVDANVSCNGGSNGAATVNITGGTAPYTYEWDNNATTASIADVAAGTYNVTVTDANGCTGTASVTITQPTALIATTGSQTNIACNGSTNGSATVAVAGGTQPYTYDWGTGNSGGTVAAQGFETTGSWNYLINPAVYNTEGDPVVSGSDDVWNIIEAFSSNIDAASEGTHFFGIQDINNDNGGGNFAHTITFEPIDISDKGELTLSFDYYTIGFDSPDSMEYIVAFDNGNTWTNPVALDKNTGAWETVTITVPASADYVRLRLQATQDGASDYAGFDNIKLFEAPVVQGPTLNNLSAGTYTVTVTDANGCEATQSFTITEPAALTASAGSQTNVSCNGGTNGSATVSVS
uniref:beta strand repeat-containing protein n=1 Tax=Flavobacterium sp. MK4S-17 TaxID=2543737 RepID=UPI00191644E8